MSACVVYESTGSLLSHPPTRAGPTVPPVGRFRGPGPGGPAKRVLPSVGPVVGPAITPRGGLNGPPRRVSPSLTLGLPAHPPICLLIFFLCLYIFFYVFDALFFIPLCYYPRSFGDATFDSGCVFLLRWGDTPQTPDNEPADLECRHKGDTPLKTP